MMVLLGNILYKWRMVRNQLIHLYLLQRYRKSLKSVGQGVRFNGICRVTGAENIEIEDNVHIGDNAFIRGEGGLFIGANTHTSRNLVIYTHNHNYEGEVLPYDNSFRFRKVTIERNVWIGMNVVILPGAHIGEGAIIGAGCVVSGKVEPLAILGAVPGKVLKYRNKEHYQKLEQNKRYGGSNGIPLED
ncbi:MAG: acyltransferase [Calditrichota bacterium]